MVKKVAEFLSNSQLPQVLIILKPILLSLSLTYNVIIIKGIDIIASLLYISNIYDER